MAICGRRLSTVAAVCSRQGWEPALRCARALRHRSCLCSLAGVRVPLASSFSARLVGLNGSLRASGGRPVRCSWPIRTSSDLADGRSRIRRVHVVPPALPFSAQHGGRRPLRLVVGGFRGSGSRATRSRAACQGLFVVPEATCDAPGRTLHEAVEVSTWCFAESRCLTRGDLGGRSQGLLLFGPGAELLAQPGFKR